MHENWHSVGEDEVGEWDMDKIGSVEWAIYDYRIDGYKGGGDLLVKIGDGQYSTHCMGHCSCYGPMEYATFGGAETKGAKEIIRSMTPATIDGVVVDGNQKILDKWRELEPEMFAEPA